MRIPLKGIGVGDGLTDPALQVGVGGVQKCDWDVWAFGRCW